MSQVLLFAAGAIALVGIVLFLLLFALRRPGAAGAMLTRQRLNAAIYRDELAELERDRVAGELAQEDFEQASAELQRRLLEDSAVQEAAPAAVASRKLPLLLALLLPLGAALGYLALGHPAALNPPPAEQRFSQADIEKMVSGLAARLEQEPGNLQGWVMLARSYKAMGRLPEAVRAYERAGSAVGESADLLVDYADTLAARDGGFTPQVRSLIDQALKLDPENLQGLWLRGTVAFEDKSYAKAAADWERLLKLLPPDSEDTRIVSANIDEARQKGGLPAAKPKAGSGKAAAASKAFAEGRVEMAKSLQVPAGAVLMVVARPNDGSRMPVAVLRVPAAGQALAFRLDDSAAMSPDRRPSQFAELVIEARVSQSGQAIPQPGDLFGPSRTVKLGAKDVVLKVDQTRQ